MNLDRAEKIGRIRRHRGIPGYLPATTITPHIRRLLAAGWTRVDIAAHAGIGRRTIQNILTGQQPNVQRHTATAITRLRPADAPTRVAAVGTVRRIQALACIGWAAKQTGQDAGLTSSFTGDLVAGAYQRIPRAAAVAVDEVFRARCMTPGPSSVARTVAARNGWVAPLAWDDIDDPDEQPSGVRRAAS